MELQKALPALNQIKQELEIARLAAIAQAGYILSQAKEHAESHEMEAKAARVIVAAAEAITLADKKPESPLRKPPEFVLTNIRLRRALKNWRIIVLILAAGWIALYILIHLHKA